MAEHCAWIKEDGNQCGAYAIKDSVYCVGHDKKAETVEEILSDTCSGHCGEEAEEWLYRYAEGFIL